MNDTLGQLHGRCLCGTVRYEAALPSRGMAHCHCANCRLAHGAGVVTYIGFPPEAMRFTAGEELLTDFVSDTNATRRFCSRCGSTLLYASPRWPESVHLLAANLDGPFDRQPSAHIYADRAPAWCPITDDLPRYGGESGEEPL